MVLETLYIVYHYTNPIENKKNFDFRLIFLSNSPWFHWHWYNHVNDDHLVDELLCHSLQIEQKTIKKNNEKIWFYKVLELEYLHIDCIQRNQDHNPIDEIVEMYFLIPTIQFIFKKNNNNLIMKLTWYSASISWISSLVRLTYRYNGFGLKKTCECFSFRKIFFELFSFNLIECRWHCYWSRRRRIFLIKS